MPLGDRVTLNYGKALKAENRTEATYPVLRFQRDRRYA